MPALIGVGYFVGLTPTHSAWSGSLAGEATPKPPLARHHYGKDAAEYGYFASGARGRWFESNSVAQVIDSSVGRALTVTVFVSCSFPQ